jgi:RHS repeat-associated protein
MASTLNTLLDRSIRLLVVMGMVLAAIDLEPSTSIVQASAGDPATLNEAAQQVTVVPPTLTQPLPVTPVVTPTTTLAASATPLPSQTARATATSVISATASPTPDVTATPTVEPPPDDEVDISPSGGVLLSRNGRMRVEFPVGAITETVRASYTRLTVAPGRPFDRHGLAPVETFNLRARGLRGVGAEIREFQTPVTVTVDLTGILSLPLPKGQVPWFGFHDPQQNRWVSVPFTIDRGPAGDRVRFVTQTRHFSTWTVGRSLIGGWVPTYNEPQVALFAGGAVFDYPLEFPAGRGGLQPQMSLNYNSRQIDGTLGWVQGGWVGYGFELDMPQITREFGGGTNRDRAECTSTLRLQINGTGYTLIQGEQIPGLGQRYYTQTESPLYIERRNNGMYTNAGSPVNATGEYWIVRDAKGVEYRLGYNPDAEMLQVAVENCVHGSSYAFYANYGSQQTSGWLRAAFAWRVDRIRDLSQNEISLTYTQDTRTTNCSWIESAGSEQALYLSSMSYNGGSSTINFVLEDRPNNGNQYDGHGLCDALLHQRRFLRAIEVRHNSSLIRRYNLGYWVDPNDVPDNPAMTRLLTSIQQVGSNGTSTLPLTEFIYTEKMANRGWSGCTQKSYECSTFGYRRLGEIRNGYGARTVFSYEHDLRASWLFHNYRVTTRDVYDGWNASAARTEYSYGIPCYNTNTNWFGQWGGTNCRSPWPALETHALTGYAAVTETVRNYNNNVLAIRGHFYLTSENSSRSAGSEHASTWREPLVGYVPRIVQREYSVWDTGSNRWAMRVMRETERMPPHSGNSISLARVTAFSYDAYGNVIQEFNYGGEVWLSNAGFENGTADWSTYPGTIPPWTTTTSERFAGRSSLVLSGSNYGNAWRDVDVVASHAYVIRAKVRATSSSGQQFMLSLHDTQSGNWQGTGWINPGTDWTTVSVNYTANNTGKVRIHLEYTPGPGSIYVDEVAIAPAGEVGDEESIHRFYLAPLTTPNNQWITGLVWAENVFDTITHNFGAWDGLLKTQTFYYYDDQTHDVTRYGSANVTMTRGLLTMIGRGYRRVPTINPNDPFVTTRYTYDSFGNRQTETDARGYTTTGTYDSSGVFLLEVNGPLTTVNDVTRYEYYGINGVPTNGNPVGTLRAEIDPNNATTSYTYDVHSRVTRVVRPGDTESLPTIEYQYTDAYNFNGLQGTRVHVINRENSGSGLNRPIVKFYDGLARLVQERAESVEASQQAVTNYVYDGLGRKTITYIPTSEGFSWEFSRPGGWNSRPSTTTVYDVLGRTVSSVAPDGTSTTAAHLGRTLAAVDANGHYRTNVTDANGQLVRVEETLTSVEDPFTTIDTNRWSVYNPCSCVSLNNGGVRLTGGAGNWVTEPVVQRSVANIGDSSVQGVKFEFMLDSGTSETHFQLQKGTWGQSDYRRAIVLAFNSAIYARFTGAPQDYTLISPVELNVWYVGVIRVNAATNQATIEVWRRDDPSKRGTASYNMTPTNSSNFQFYTTLNTGNAWLDNYHELKYLTTSYIYSALGEVTRITNPLGHTTVITYDILSRKTAMNDPNLGVWNYTYDAAGNAQTQSDARLNSTLWFNYDPLNRLTEKRETNSGGPLLARYFYDQNTNGIGRRTRMEDASGYTTWSYDSRGRVITHAQTFTHTALGTYTTTYAYDAMDRVTAIGYPSGEVVTQTYSAQASLENVRSQTYGQWLSSNLDYDATGRLELMTYGDDLFRADPAYYPWTQLYGHGRLQYMRIGTSTNPTAIQFWEYGYDAVANVSNITDHTNSGQMQSFTYDALDRLRTAQTTIVGNGWYNLENYNYDDLGNLLTKAGMNYAYAATVNTSQCSTGTAASKPQAVSSTSGSPLSATFSYDCNGNMTGRVEGTTIYTHTFDVDNQLIRVASNVSGTTEFVYDGDGARVLQLLPDGRRIAYLSGLMEIEVAAPTPTNTPTATPTQTFTPTPTATATSTPTSSGGGSLAGTIGTPGSTVNLTTEGAADWTHWGRGSASGFDRKNGVTAQISNYTQIGSIAAAYYNDNLVGFSWTDGTPAASATNNTEAIYIRGLNNGFQITAPADTTLRTLRFYVGVWNARGRLQVSLSDNSAAIYIDSSLNNTTGNDGGTVGVYTLTYRAASAGQTLTVQWTVMDSYHTYGNVQLQATTLQLAGPTATPTSTPTPTATTCGGFPSIGILDNFNRANGGIGTNWAGSTGGYSIAGNQLDIGTGADIYWSPVSFGADQEAYVTITTIDGAASEFGLILKAQSNAGRDPGLIEVLYDPYDTTNGEVQVWTWNGTWQQIGGGTQTTFVNGDRLGARARPDGQIEVYRNGTLLTTRDVSGWAYAGNGGYIGMWTVGAGSGVLDDFGGGTYAGCNGPTSTPTSLPTSTTTPTNTPVGPTATSTNTPTSTPAPTSTPTNTPPPTPTNTSSGCPTSDDFNRANSTSLGNNWTERAGDLEITNNLLLNVNTATDNIATLCGTYTNVLASSQVQIASGSGTVSVGARLGGYSGGIPSQGYVAEIASDGTVNLYRVDNFTSLGSYTISGFSLGTWYTLGLRANGSSISVEINGNAVIGPVTNTAFTSGDVGMWSYSPSSNGSHRFDNFSITVLGGGFYAKSKGLAMRTYTKVRRPQFQSGGTPPAGHTWRVYYYADDDRIAMREITNSSDTLSYLISDHLGSSSVTINSSGTVTARQYFKPWGEIRYSTGVTPTRFGFTGQRLDETGLMFYGARYYYPVLGRFISPDARIPEPQNAQAHNRYAYSVNNPVKYTDPSGHWVETAFDVISLGMTINDIRNEGFTFWNTVSLVTDIASIILPAVPAGASHVIRAFKYGNKVINAADTVGDVTKIITKADDALDVARQTTAAVTKADMVADLASGTAQSQRIAGAMEKGDIGVNILGQNMFEKAYLHFGGDPGDVSRVAAFARGSQTYFRQGSGRIFGDAVHEGTHALQILEGFKGTVSDFEIMAYYFEREFLLGKGRLSDFATLDEMFEHIAKNYPW